MNAGTLELQLMANIARLQQDMNTATQLVQSSSAKMASDLGDIKKSIESSLAPLQSLTVKFGSLESQIDRAQSAAISLGKGLLLGAAAGMSIDAIKNKILGVIDSMANLKTLSEKTGSSVENLSKLAFFGKQSGTDIDAITAALGKMSKGMAGADDETKGAGAALKYLGISAKDASGNLKDPSAMFTEIAGKLALYSDGAGKAAIAQALFGKSGADMLPTLKLIAEQGDIEAKVTDAQAAAARQYQRDLAKLDAQKGQLFKTVAVSLLPTMTDFAAVLLDAAKKTNVTNDAVKSLAKDNSITDWADAGAMGLARLLDVFLLIPKTATAVIGSFKAVAADLTVLQTLSPQGISAAVSQGKNPIAEFKAALDERNKVLAQSNANYDALWNAEGNRFEKAMAAAIAKRKAATQEVAATPELAPLNFSTASSAAADNAYKAYLAKQDGLYKLEEDGLAAHLQALESQHARALIGDVQYLDQRHAAEQQAVIDEIAIRQKELAAAQQDPTNNAKDIEKYTAEINQLNAKRKQLDDADAERRVTLEHTIQQTIEGIDTEAMKKRGDLVGAFIADFSKRYMDVMIKAQLDGNTELQAAIEQAWKAGLSEASFNQTRAQFDALFSGMSNDIQQVQDVAGANGGLLARINAAGVADSIREKAIPALQDYVTQLQVLAASSNNSALVKQANDMARALTQQIQKVQPVWNDMIKSIDDTFESGLEASMSNVSGAWNSFTTDLKNKFKKNLIDEIYQMFLKPFVMQVVVSGANSLGLSGLANAASLAGGGGSSGTSGVTSLLQTGKAAYDTYSMALGSSLGTAVAGFGNLIGSSAISAFGSGMGLTASQAAAAAQAYSAAGATETASALTAGSSAGAALGAAGSIGAGVLGGVYGGRAISGEYGSNGTVNTGVAAGAAIGTVILPVLGTAVGALIGGLVGGLANRAFGMGNKEVTSQSIQGALNGNAAFTGNNVATWHQDGGWFRSDKNGTDTSPVDDTTAKAFTDSYASIRAISGALATTLGVDASSLATRSQALNITITGDATKDQQAVADFFSGVADTIAVELVPNLASFQATGETLSATLQRVSTDYAGVDLVLKTLGATAQSAFGATGTAAIGFSEGLIKAAGSLDSLTSGTTYFAENFLTPAQQIAPIVDDVKASLASLGMAGVNTTQEYADAVLKLTQSGALATAAGQAQYAALLALAPQFKQAADYTDGLTNALGGLVSVTRSASDVASEHADLQNQLNKLTLTAAQLTALQRDAIDDSNKALFDQVQAEQAKQDASAAAAAAATAAADDQAKILDQQAQLYAATGDAAGAAAVLEQQHEAALVGLSPALAAATQATWDAQAAATAKAASDKAAADALATSNSLLDIQAQIYQVTGDKAGAAAVLEQQHIAALAAMDPALRGATEQLYAVQAAAASQQAAADALSGFAQGIQATVDAAKSAIDTFKKFKDSLYVGDQSPLSKQDQYTVAKAQFEAAGPNDLQAAATTFLTAAKATDSVIQYAKDFSAVQAALDSAIKGKQGTIAGAGNVAQSFAQALAGAGIGAHANGGIASGLSLVGERGPELVDFQQPARVYTASQTSGMLGSSQALVDRLDTLIEQSGLMHDESKKTAKASQSTADTLQRATKGGTALYTVPA
jgi:hypothetical protein